MSEQKQQTFIEKCFKDEEGNLGLFQSPNLPVIVWLSCLLLSRLIETGRLHDLLVLVGFGALFTWAWLELFSGTNYFRRALGLVVLAYLLYSHI